MGDISRVERIFQRMEQANVEASLVYVRRARSFDQC